jgi:alpha 1,2-mannosyltransferase
MTITGNGRGIVMTTANRLGFSGPDALSLTASSICLLRNEYFSQLPIEVFHLPSERPTEAQAAIFLSLGADLSEINPDIRGNGTVNSYQIKARAIIESTFDEVLYLDSDSRQSSARSLSPP